MNCADPATFGPYERISLADRRAVAGGQMMYQSFTIDIPERADPSLTSAASPMVELAVTLVGAAQARFHRCASEHPASAAATREQLGRAVVHRQSPPATLELRPGTWRVDVLRDYGPPSPVVLTIQRQRSASASNSGTSSP
jgi:hypothetical protein